MSQSASIRFGDPQPPLPTFQEMMRRINIHFQSGGATVEEAVAAAISQLLPSGRAVIDMAWCVMNASPSEPASSYFNTGSPETLQDLFAQIVREGLVLEYHRWSPQQVRSR